jgi:ribosomal protein L11 methyltransferase
MRSWPALDISRPADLLEAALLDYNIAAIDETGGTWRVFFAAPADRDAALAALPSQFPELTFTAVDVPDADWAARSQASLRAIQVGNIVVAPPWDLPQPSDPPPPLDLPPEGGSHTDVASGFSRKVIVIQPSMGFGTGHHATTRLCLAALQRIELHGRSVLDVGTGSGVLAIAASRLGAAPVVAIDDDPDAIQAARENVGLNEGVGVELRTVDLRAADLGTFDAVIANLTGALLIQAAARLLAVGAVPGRMILSGFMAHEEADVLAAYAALHVERRAQEDEWLCVIVQR